MPIPPGGLASSCSLRDDLPLEPRLGSAQDPVARRRGAESCCAPNAVFTGSATSWRTTAGIALAQSGASWQATYHAVDTPERFAAFLDELKRQPRFCIDTETTAIDPLRADLVGIVILLEARGGLLLAGPRAGRMPNCSTRRRLSRRCDPSWRTTKSKRSARISSTTCWRSGRAGVDLDGPVTDTMVLSYLLESGERNHNLDQLSQRLLDHTMIPITDLIGKGKSQGRMDEVAVDRVAEYAGEDADATWRIETILAAKVREQGLWELYAELERPLIAVLARMEAAGSDGRRRAAAAVVARVRGPDHDDRDRGIQSGGPDIQHQLGAAAPPGAFRRAEACRRCRRRPAASRARPRTFWKSCHSSTRSQRFSCSIASSRSSRAHISTHFPGWCIPRIDRIHASFNQSVAATGRLSSSDPNLQNIPVRTEDGRQIRQAFVAGQARLAALDGRLFADRAADPRPLFRRSRPVPGICR